MQYYMRNCEICKDNLMKNIIDNIIERCSDYWKYLQEYKVPG